MGAYHCLKKLWFAFLEHPVQIGNRNFVTQICCDSGLFTILTLCHTANYLFSNMILVFLSFDTCKRSFSKHASFEWIY